jgi:hypothetical protein
MAASIYILPSAGKRSRRPTTDADLGIAWWNALTERERMEALKAADSDCPAEGCLGVAELLDGIQRDMYDLAHPVTDR